MKSRLRERVAELREYMFGGGGTSYPGPEPGNLSAMNFYNPMHNPVSSSALFARGGEDQKKAEAAKYKKQIAADKRRKLRKMAQWQQKGQ